MNCRDTGDFDGNCYLLDDAVEGGNFEHIMVPVSLE